ncbi:NAD(P)-binding protein [Gyrodon lividus]|nr:NAD(P)-binding protein [Gyrodon lividus]
MRIAVTGCNGRVGQQVVLTALRTGHTVVGIDNVPNEDTEFRSDPDFTFALGAFNNCGAIVQLASIAQPIDDMVNTHNRTGSHLQLGIERVAQASSVNVLRGIFSTEPHFDYFPIDEHHPTLPDEPYGLSKLIAEIQADTIVRRYPTVRVASIRIHLSAPTRMQAYRNDMAFVRAVTVKKDNWTGHEKFFIVAPQIAADEDWIELKEKYFQDVPMREGWVESEAKCFFDCSKAERVLGWVHKDYA